MAESTLIILSKPPAAGRWIPPLGLIAGQLAHGISWPLLAWIAVSEGAGSTSWLELGWLHLVALGWVTLTALSILIHVIPAFTDAVWRFEKTARRSLAIYAAGVAVLVAAFCTGSAAALPWAGALIGLGLLGYLVPAGATLAGALHNEKAEAAIARALLVTLGVLALTAALGVAFTWALAGRAPGAMLRFAPVHAELGLFAWLTILLIGVSVKTIGPIAGNRSRVKWRHVAAAGSIFAGTLLLASGSASLATALSWCGVATIAFGTVLYIVDIAVVLRRATVPHRVPQAFIAAALVWLGIALVLGIGTLAGLPCARAFVYVVLVGWIGQMVNAHMHHIGVRLLITAFRGDEDETRPGEVLRAPLSWTAFVLFQLAVAAGALAAVNASSPLLIGAASAGGIAWLATIANAASAVRRLRPGAARSQPRTA